jgi:hypothetical protein
MKRTKILSIFTAFLVLIGVFCFMNIQALAAGNDAVSVSVPQDADQGLVPPDAAGTGTDHSEGYSMTDSTVWGACSISRTSSSSVICKGWTSCSAWDPAVKVTLKLQAYYDGGWHTLHQVSNTTSGTYVEKAQGYSVTPGYYYRTYAAHSIYDGTTTYSWTAGIYVG